MRDFLLYVAGPRGACEAELFGPERIYDVAYNDYTGEGLAPTEAEYRFSEDEWKFRHFKKALAGVAFDYRAVALLDDDVRISTRALNATFRLAGCGWSIWQPALNPNSQSSWRHLCSRGKFEFRPTNTIELMMPFFSRHGLEVCFPTFDANYSGWGLQVVWNHLLDGKGIIVVDAAEVGHYRPMSSHARVMPNGLTPHQEAAELLARYGLRELRPDEVY